MRTSQCFKTVGSYAGRDELDYGIVFGDKVLDIGGGTNPFKHATHILDSTSLEYDQQRYGRGITLEEHQQLIDGTTDKLVEFAENEFDFIYCSHVLEHVHNLPEVMEEISRVGKRGFVAVPHCLYDAWAAPASSGHKWFCDYDYINDIFLIRKRPPNHFIATSAELWNDVMWGDDGKKNLYWNVAFEGHNCGGIRMFWEIRFFWNGKIDYKVDETILPQFDLFVQMIDERDKESKYGD